jgi:predicted RNase H-like HicB family nuclease
VREVVYSPTSREEAIALSLEAEQEEDGRWIAEVRDPPGVLAHGATEAEAIARAEARALRVPADRFDPARRFRS